jgi:hypothetical protein
MRKQFADAPSRVSGNPVSANGAHSRSAELSQGRILNGIKNGETRGSGEPFR